MLLILDSAITTTEKLAQLFQSLSNALTNNVALVISLVSISISIYNWYRSRISIKFYDYDVAKNIYKPTHQYEYNYKDSTTIAFVYVEINNLSSLPCTINQFTLSVDGYPDTLYRSSHAVRKEYVLGKTKPNVHQSIFEENILKLPCALQPFGFAYGYLVFPYCPDYQGENLKFTLKARIGKKHFKFSQSLHTWEHIRNLQDHQ